MARTTLIYTVTGKEITNSLYWTQDDEWSSEAQLLALATNLADVWDESMPGTMTPNVFLTGIRATALQSADAPSVLYEPSGTHQGTASGAETPLHTAITATLRTAGRGRSRRGRLYHYGLPVTAMENEHQWNTTARALIASKYTDMWIAMQLAGESDGLTQVIVSYQQDGVPLEAGEAFALTSIDSHLYVATQRRRVKP